MASVNYEYIMIRFGELTTKGKNKKEFIRQLCQNMKAALENFQNLTYEWNRDHIYIHLHGTDPELLTPVLKNIFGIRSFAKTLKAENDPDAICAAAQQLMADKTGTFKVITRRANKRFEIHSEEMNRLVAKAILVPYGQQLKVDVHQPDYPLIVEIRDEATYLMCETVLGAGGYPVGVGKKAMMMISGGIDSPVAAYLTMKRGVQIECIHYASQPYTSQAALNKVKELVRKLSGYQGQIRLHVVPFTDLQLAIYQHCDESYAITIMRRMMYRLAQELAIQNHCLAIVNGESVGQVASQTLDSMGAINAVTTLPVLRPVVTYDKLEIIEMANKIDTYATSILPFEDCCTIFTPKNPVTSPKISKCEYFESHFDWQSLLEAALEKTETICINPSSRFDEEEDIL